jgi:hypothetical protein
MLWTKGWRLRFDSWLGKEFSLLLRVQIKSGAHAVTYPMGTWGDFLGGKQTGLEVNYLPPSTAKIKLYLYSHICLHSTELN